MFSDKNYGLPKELIEAAKRVHEKQLEENLVTEEEIAEAFAIFLEENFHVEMLTKEDIDYVFENEFCNQLDERNERNWLQFLSGKSRAQAKAENRNRTAASLAGENAVINNEKSKTAAMSGGFGDFNSALSAARDRQSRPPRSPEGGGSQRIGARAPAPPQRSPEWRPSALPGARAPAPSPRPEGRPSALPGAQAPAVGVFPDEDALIKRAKTNAATGGLGDGNSAFSAARKRQTATPGNQVSAKPAASARKSAPKIDYKTPVTRRGPDGTYGLTGKGRGYVARKAPQERNDWRAAAFKPKD